MGGGPELSSAIAALIQKSLTNLLAPTSSDAVTKPVTCCTGDCWSQQLAAAQVNGPASRDSGQACKRSGPHSRGAAGRDAPHDWGGGVWP